MNIAWSVPAFISGCALLQWMSEWYLARDVDYEEGTLAPKGWLQWGTCRSLNRKGANDFRYFYLRLPFLYWWERSCAAGGDGYREGWHQLVVMKFHTHWYTYMRPCDDARFVSGLSLLREGRA